MLRLRRLNHKATLRHFSALPVIDISPWAVQNSTQNSKTEVCKKIDAACREVGFFYVVGHGVNPKLQKSVIDLGRAFFELDQEEKEKISIVNSKTYRGYQKLGQNITQSMPDWHEAIDFFAEPKPLLPYDRSFPLHGPNQWPQHPQSFRPTFESYLKEVETLSRTLMKIFALCLDVPPDFFEKYTQNPWWILRVIGYPPIPKDTPKVGFGCGTHTDYGCLTLVNQDHVGGLEVLTPDGKWVEGVPIPESFVVNIGDMLSHWTNGIYKSTPHRVINKTKDTYRVSVPYFFEPDYEAVITPIRNQQEIPYVSQFGTEPIVYGQHVVKKITNNFDFKI